MAEQRDLGIRETTFAMRWMLLVASFLVFGVGVVLVLFPNRTEDLFAWTIQPPLTAAFLGGGYWASCALEYLCYRERIWANARIAVFAVFFFTFLTLVATVMHQDRFHFNDPDFITAWGTWIWLAVYAIVPLLMGAFIIDQWQAPGQDPQRIAPLPHWIRYFFLIEGLLLVELGILLFVTPENTAHIWPWALTPLMGRAVGAWLIGIGISEVQLGIENDWQRLRPAFISMLIFVVLQLLALARFNDIPDWGQGTIWVYIAFMLSMGAKSLYGLQQYRHLPDSQQK